MCVGAKSKYPRDQAARVGVGGQKDLVSPARSLARLLAIKRVGIGVTDLAVATKVTFDLPGDPPGDQHLGNAPLLTQLPVGAVGIGTRVEVSRPTEIVLGL